MGQVQTRSDQEYGPQDFYGVIDELRVWRSVRTQAQIAAVRSSFYEGMFFPSCCSCSPLTHTYFRSNFLFTMEGVFLGRFQR